MPAEDTARPSIERNDATATSQQDPYQEWAEAFKAPYTDSGSATNLRKYIVTSAKRTDLCAKVLSIIQSSGTGKTRALDHIAESIFTIPICLRDTNTDGKSTPLSF